MSQTLDALGREISRATCCWCGTNLVKAAGHYFCPQTPCNLRQRERAVTLMAKKHSAKTGASHQQFVLYVPTPKQAEFDERPERYVLFGGAAGPGKSHAARWALYRRCMAIPGFEALLLRRTFPELEKTHLRRMAGEAQRFKDLGYAVDFIDSKRLMRFPNGSLIECGHMEDADAVNKYLSTEYDCIVPDEGSQYQPKPLLELSTRARTSKPAVLAAGGAKFWVVTNPGGPAHALLKDLFIDHNPDFDDVPVMRDSYKPEEWAYVKASLDDNPYIDPEYERNLAVLAMTSPFRYEQLRHGDWDATDGQFFGEWRPQVNGQPYHVRTMEIPDDCEWYADLDWGYNAPGCLSFTACLPDLHTHTKREFKFQGLSAEVFATKYHEIKKDLGIKRVRYVACDPAMKARTGHARGESIFETLQRRGIPVRGSDNDRFNGWLRFHENLQEAPDGMPWWTVDPSCKYLIRSIGGAVSDPKAPDDINTATDDHALDMKRYGFMSRPSPTSKLNRREIPKGSAGAMLTEVMTRNTARTLGVTMVR